MNHFFNVMHTNKYIPSKVLSDPGHSCYMHHGSLASYCWSDAQLNMLDMNTCMEARIRSVQLRSCFDCKQPEFLCMETYSYLYNTLVSDRAQELPNGEFCI
jgi:hypothetical protein